METLTPTEINVLYLGGSKFEYDSELFIGVRGRRDKNPREMFEFIVMLRCAHRTHYRFVSVILLTDLGKLSLFQ